MGERPPEFRWASKSDIVSPGFIAPELFLETLRLRFDQLKYGTEIDIWGIGVIMLQMLCGTNPFEKNFPLEFPDPIIKENPEAIISILSEAHAAALGPPTPQELAQLVRTPPIYKPTYFKNEEREKNLVNYLHSVIQYEVDPLEIHLLSMLLAYDPRSRPRAYEILQHPYFIDTSSPVVSVRPPREVADPPGWSDVDGFKYSHIYARQEGISGPFFLPAGPAPHLAHLFDSATRREDETCLKHPRPNVIVGPLTSRNFINHDSVFEDPHVT
eukprot:GHVT01077859.1.p1 GENE.GHVT01077859.1~~GHVT01077859.1.p1  ORF type:complete len:271 (+),score=16.67 GHVT01077859.1:1165-1977(+)